MISVIIPAKNAAATLEDCLKAAFAQRGLSAVHEVIVVDDGSTDATAEIAKKCGARLICQTNAGPAAARNAGANAAQGEILAFTDADCVPAPDWLASLTAPLAGSPIVGAKGAYRTRQRSLIARFVQQEYESKYDRLSHQIYIDFVDTYSAAYRREIFQQNGGFETAFPVPSVEDQEFSFRLARKGYRLVFVPNAIVYHQHDTSLGEYLRRKYGIGYWKSFMLRWIPEKALSDSHTLPSQRWQIAFLAAFVFFFALIPFWRNSLWLGLVSLGLFYITAIPLLTRIVLSDRRVALVAPWLLLGRSVAQGLGLGIGFLLPPRTLPHKVSGLGFTAHFLKRLIDILGALVGLIISLPILILAAIAIKLDSRGHVIFAQERAGENGRPFKMFKLRTMTDSAADEVERLLVANPLKGPVFKIPRDPRVTRVGRILRRWSVDELPQLWNVVRGEMSLVGPRPEEVWIVAQYDDRQRQRLAVKPGMTGPMQVAGRGELDMEARLLLDLDYIQHYNLGRDFLILWRTIPAVISGRGAF